jgi:hypothetical protein
MNHGMLHMNLYCDFLIFILILRERLKADRSLSAVVTEFRNLDRYCRLFPKMHE